MSASRSITQWLEDVRGRVEEGEDESSFAFKGLESRGGVDGDGDKLAVCTGGGRLVECTEGGRLEGCTGGDREGMVPDGTLLKGKPEGFLVGSLL